MVNRVYRGSLEDAKTSLKKSKIYLNNVESICEKNLRKNNYPIHEFILQFYSTKTSQYEFCR